MGKKREETEGGEKMRESKGQKNEKRVVVAKLRPSARGSCESAGCLPRLAPICGSEIWPLPLKGTADGDDGSRCFGRADEGGDSASATLTEVSSPPVRDSPWSCSRHLLQPQRRLRAGVDCESGPTSGPRAAATRIELGLKEAAWAQWCCF